MAKTDQEKFVQYEAEGMTDRQKARLLAESNAEPVGGAFPSFAQEIDDKPTFLDQSNTENFNKNASVGYGTSDEPQVTAKVETIPDFMKNSG